MRLWRGDSAVAAPRCVFRMEPAHLSVSSGGFAPCTPSRKGGGAPPLALGWNESQTRLARAYGIRILRRAQDERATERVERMTAGVAR